MLVGPSKTLAQIEEQMNNKISMNKMEIKGAQTELAKLNQEYNSLPKIKGEPPTGRMIEVVNRIRELQARVDEMANENDKWVQKLEEAEKDPNKDRKIPLTLKDLMDLGFEE
jgi:outer membrane murein-binding lipoprotein Lpp